MLRRHIFATAAPSLSQPRHFQLLLPRLFSALNYKSTKAAATTALAALLTFKDCCVAVQNSINSKSSSNDDQAQLAAVAQHLGLPSATVYSSIENFRCNNSNYNEKNDASNKEAPSELHDESCFAVDLVVEQQEEEGHQQQLVQLQVIDLINDNQIVTTIPDPHKNLAASNLDDFDSFAVVEKFAHRCPTQLRGFFSPQRAEAVSATRLFCKMLQSGGFDAVIVPSPPFGRRPTAAEAKELDGTSTASNTRTRTVNSDDDEGEPSNGMKNNSKPITGSNSEYTHPDVPQQSAEDKARTAASVASFLDGGVYNNPERAVKSANLTKQLLGSFIVMVYQPTCNLAFRRVGNTTAAASNRTEAVAFFDADGNHFLPPLAIDSFINMPNLDGYDTLVIHGAKEAILLLSQRSDAENRLSAFLRRGGKVWCTAYAEYCLSGFREQAHKLSIPWLFERNNGKQQHDATESNTTSSSNIYKDELEAAASRFAGGYLLESLPLRQLAAERSKHYQQQQQQQPAVERPFPATSSDFTAARLVATALASIFLGQVARAADQQKHAQLLSIAARMDFVLLLTAAERSGLHVDESHPFVSFECFREDTLAWRRSEPLKWSTHLAASSEFRPTLVTADLLFTLNLLAQRLGMLDELRSKTMLFHWLVTRPASAFDFFVNSSRKGRGDETAFALLQRDEHFFKSKSGVKANATEFAVFLIDFVFIGSGLLVEVSAIDVATGKRFSTLCNPSRKLTEDEEKILLATSGLVPDNVSVSVLESAPSLRNAIRDLCEFLQVQEFARRTQRRVFLVGDGILFPTTVVSSSVPTRRTSRGYAEQLEHVFQSLGREPLTRGGKVVFVDAQKLVGSNKNKIKGSDTPKPATKKKQPKEQEQVPTTTTSPFMTKQRCEALLSNLKCGDTGSTATMFLLKKIMQDVIANSNFHRNNTNSDDESAASVRRPTRSLSKNQNCLGFITLPLAPELQLRQQQRKSSPLLPLQQVALPLIRESTEIAKFVAAPVDSRRDNIDATLHEDRCIRQEFRLCETATGRTAARLPNCQSIPKRDEEEDDGNEDKSTTTATSATIRKVFTSHFGKHNGWMIEVDFKQLEVAVLALLSQDPNMISDLENGVDFHLKRCVALLSSNNKSSSTFSNKTYRQLLSRFKAGDAHVKELRNKAKLLSFQRMYGASALSLQKSSDLSPAAIAQLIRQESEMYPLAENLPWFSQMLCLRKHDSVAADDENGDDDDSPEWCTHELPTGARVSLPRSDVETMQPTLKNYPVQSYAAELVSILLGKLYRALLPMMMLSDGVAPKVAVVNFVHDSVWLDCHDSVVKEVVQLVSSVMSSLQETLASGFPGAPHNVKLGVSVSIGRNLAEMQAYDEKVLDAMMMKKKP